MRIGGFQKFSMIDYPGKICAVVFTHGCNFRCPYCHNPELVRPGPLRENIPEEDVFAFLAKREDRLDGITITGGEPTLQPNLLKFMKRLRNMNFLVKLDTNGSRPDVLREVFRLGFADFVAMDIKAPLWKYGEVAGPFVDTSFIEESVSLIRNSGTEYLFRTTLAPGLVTDHDILEIRNWLGEGVPHLRQDFSSTKLLDPVFFEAQRAVAA